MSETAFQAKIGDLMEEGTILAGYNKGKSLYATPQDAPLSYTFNDAAKFAEQLNAQKFLAHDDWRVPSIEELNILYNNRNKGHLKSTFHETGKFHERCYWSSSLMEHEKHSCLSSPLQDYGFMRDFGTTSEYSAVREEPTHHALRLHCVRG